MFPRLCVSADAVHADRMSISEERVREFIRVYKEEFGDDLSVNEALDMLTRLVVLYRLIARPLPNEKPRRDQDIGEGEHPEASPLP
jgi:hypothetical protein